MVSALQIKHLFYFQFFQFQETRVSRIFRAFAGFPVQIDTAFSTQPRTRTPTQEFYGQRQVNLFPDNIIEINLFGLNKSNRQILFFQLGFIPSRFQVYRRR